MKLKETNDVLEKVIADSLSQLSKVYSETQDNKEIKFIFEFWNNVRHLDLDKNICYTGVIDVRAEKQITGGKTQVVSFKRLYDKMIVHRPNIGTPEQPKYGKQLNFEESRNAVLREIIGKSVSGLALGLAQRTKEQIEEFNKVVNEEQDGSN